MKQRLPTERKKTLSPKKAQEVGGNLYNWYENFSDTHTKRWMVRFFYIENTQKTILKTRLYELIRSAFSQPLALAPVQAYAYVQ
jgi:hypothetical protein